MFVSRTKTRELILKGNLYRVILVISLPIVITNVLQSLYELADIFYVGKLGSMPLAALSFIGPINFLIMGFAMGMSIGSVSLMSRCIGEEVFTKFSKYAGQLIFLNVVMSLIITVLVLIFMDLVLNVMDVSGELRELTKSYFYVVTYAIPVMFMSISIIYILNSQGETLIAMMLILIANIMNFILDPILIFTFDLGIAGAAWSTLFSKLIIVVSYLFFTYRLNCGLRVTLKGLKPDIVLIQDIIRLGLPAIFGQVMASLSFLIFNYVVIQISAKFLAAYGMANSIVSLLILPGISIGTGIVSIVGQNLGAKNVNRVGDTLKKGFFITFVVMLTVAIFIISLREVIIGAFTDDLEVLSYANNYLLLASIGSIGFGLQQVFFGGLIGSGFTRLAMIVIFMRLWVIRLPSVFIFQYFGIIEDSLGYALMIANYIALIILLGVTLTKYWLKAQ
ncbi:MATE family efflux transporter [Borrelia coriaceae]|nr:MATE family efflux transporter [Borrelia coriaceae]UPA16332.1 MATE family efflux transporter [Borrelia coriaceae]